MTNNLKIEHYVKNFFDGKNYGLEVIKIVIEDNFILDSYIDDVLYFKSIQERVNYIKSKPFKKKSDYKIPTNFILELPSGEIKNFNNLEDSQKYLIEHIKEVKKEYASLSEENEFEVNSLLTILRDVFHERLYLFNDTLIEYGFKKLRVS